MQGNLRTGHGSARGLLAAVTVVAAASLLAACGSSGSSSARAAAPIEAPCNQVASVLSDGPDPEADPVGYAQAQVLQLRALSIAREPLHRATDALASAYQQFSQSNGSAAAKAAVSHAVHELNAICPGAAQ